MPDLELELPEELGRLHFVGIGGSGMSGIARVFLEAGYEVTGSDRADSATLDELRRLGATIAVGHDAAHLGDADTVVVTGALWQDNPEYQEALRRGLPVLHRANALDWLIRHHPGPTRLLSIAGAHGKSTTTSMIIAGLTALDRDPSYVNGAVVAGIGRSSRIGGSELFVIEADESDSSFLLYDTEIAVITNVDTDHVDHYGSAAALDDAFVRFASSARTAVIGIDDPGARRVAARLDGPRVLTFGRDESADVRILEVIAGDEVRFTIRFEGRELSGRIPVPGEINALNAAAAVAALIATGIPAADAVRGVESFAGTGRRFEPHGLAAGVRLYDDYAHHPAEVEEALRTARSVVGPGRVIAVHQPHLFSRTQRLAGEFAEAYERLADHTVVLAVFGAREDPIPGVTGRLVSERFADPSRVDFVPDWQDAAEQVARIARPGDIVMTLSCGDVYRIIPQLRSAIEAAAGSGS